MKMDEQIRAMREQIEAAAAAITDSREMYLLRKQYLDNKTGLISALMKNMRDLTPEERPAFGKVVNELKTWALDFFTAQDARLKAIELAKKNAAEQIDVTMPASAHACGALHPNTLIANELIDIFAGMGFTIFEGHLLCLAGAAAENADLRRTDPRHGKHQAADQDPLAGQSVPLR